MRGRTELSRARRVREKQRERLGAPYSRKGRSVPGGPREDLRVRGRSRHPSSGGPASALLAALPLTGISYQTMLPVPCSRTFHCFHLAMQAPSPFLVVLNPTSPPPEPHQPREALPALPFGPGPQAHPTLPHPQLGIFPFPTTFWDLKVSERA